MGKRRKTSLGEDMKDLLYEFWSQFITEINTESLSLTLYVNLFV